MENLIVKDIRRLPSLTIAIPAHNEEKVISRILESILLQCFDVCSLDKIIVYCDGCSDNTVNNVKEFSENLSNVYYYEGNERIGKTKMLNRIFAENESDFLMVLDADIGLDGVDFIQRFVGRAVEDSRNVMFAAHQVPLRPKNIIGKFFYSSFLMWDYVRLSMPNKDHVENFYGAATIYKKSFASEIFIPRYITGMRTYLYLLAKKKGGFSYVRNASIKYWPPHTVSDFIKLTRRVYGSDLSMLEEIFGKDAQGVYCVERKYKIMGIAKFARKHPFYLAPALVISFLLVRMTRRYQKKNFMASGLWDRAQSTKQFTTSILEKNRIIFSNYDDLQNPWYAGGGALAIHEVAKRLVNYLDVMVITGKYPNCKNEFIDRVYYKRIGCCGGGPKWGQLAYSFLLIFYVIKEKFDLWFESFTPPFTTGLVPLFTSRPVVGITHMLSGLDMYRKYKIPFHYFERLGFKFYDKFIVLSQHLKNEIEKYNKKAYVEIIPNGINCRLKILDNNEKKIVIFIGRIEINQKGLDLLLNAFSKIKQLRGYKLLIAGFGNEKEEGILKKIIEEMSLVEKVKFIGRVGGEKKNKFFSEAAFVVIPSRFESFSMVALEAFSYGLPAIVFDLENLKWIPDDCAIKVKPFDENGLSMAIEKLILNPKLRIKMGNRAWELSQGFNWDNVGQKYLNYIKNIL